MPGPEARVSRLATPPWAEQIWTTKVAKKQKKSRNRLIFSPRFILVTKTWEKIELFGN